MLDIAERHVSPLLGSTPTEPDARPLEPRGCGDSWTPFQSTTPQSLLPLFDEPEDAEPEPIIVPAAGPEARCRERRAAAETLLSSAADASVSERFHPPRIDRPAQPSRRRSRTS